MRIESGAHIGHWVADRLGSRFEETDVAIGLVGPQGIQAGVIYENYNGSSVVTHIAVTGPMTRPYVSAIFDYPFRVCRVKKIIAPVAAANTLCARLVKHMGFIPEAVLKDCHPEGDLILFTLSQADCRFLKGRYVGKENPHPAACA